jgi:hypothetical protein
VIADNRIAEQAGSLRHQGTTENLYRFRRFYCFPRRNPFARASARIPPPAVQSA